MKLLMFDEFRVGVLKAGNVVDVTSLLGEISQGEPSSVMQRLIASFDRFKASILEQVAQQEGIALSTVNILPPLPRPGNIDCMAVNYMENGTRAEPAPINAFPKAPVCVVGDGATMVLPNVPATIFEGEAELGVVIGKRASGVAASEAMSYIFGYLNFIDGSARGLGPGENIFYQMKSRDTFAPIGPFIVTADEVPDPHKLQVRLWINGTIAQDFNTSDMAHNIPRSIEWVSAIHTLEPGDILATGTNHRGLTPFQDGDLVELEVEGMGRLRINVKDDLKRTWLRESRLERQERGLKGVTTPQLTGKYAAKQG